jgi:leucyl-tRNA synthetase
MLPDWALEQQEELLQKIDVLTDERKQDLAVNEKPIKRVILKIKRRKKVNE